MSFKNKLLKKPMHMFFASIAACRRPLAVSTPKNLTKSFAVAGISALLTSCALQPTPMPGDEQMALLKNDNAQARINVEPLVGELTLEEAMARGIKYNLDHRVRMMEQSVAIGQYEISQYDMLPKLTASAGYSWRNNYLVTNAVNSVTGQPSLADPYISSAKEFNTFGLALSWNILDFGVSYYNAKQNADRVLVAMERRRKAMHLIMQDVQSAFWRAASAQKLQKNIQQTITMAEKALKDSGKVEQENLSKPLDALRYQKNLLDNMRTLETIEAELSAAKVELATLINLPPGTALKIKEPRFDMAPGGIGNIQIETLEQLALLNNADLRESIYNARITVAETRKAIVRMLPGINFSYGPQYTDNSYYINKSWTELSANISGNLISMIFQGPKVINQGEAEKALAGERRMAVQMAVLGQVHLAKQQYENAKRLYSRSKTIAEVDGRIASVTAGAEKEGATSRADLVAARSSEIVSELRKYQTLAQLYASSGRLQATLGYEPELGDIQGAPLKEVEKQVSLSVKDWNNGTIVKRSMGELATVGLLESEKSARNSIAVATTDEQAAAEFTGKKSRRYTRHRRGQGKLAASLIGAQASPLTFSN